MEEKNRLEAVATAGVIRRQCRQEAAEAWKSEGGEAAEDAVVVIVLSRPTARHGVNEEGAGIVSASR